MTDYGEIQPADRARLDLMIAVARADPSKIDDLIDLAFGLGYCNGRLEGANKIAERFEAILRGKGALPA